MNELWSLMFLDQGWWSLHNSHFPGWWWICIIPYSHYSYLFLPYRSLIGFEVLSISYFYDIIVWNIDWLWKIMACLRLNWWFMVETWKQTRATVCLYTTFVHAHTHIHAYIHIVFVSMDVINMCSFILVLGITRLGWGSWYSKPRAFRWAY